MGKTREALKEAEDKYHKNLVKTSSAPLSEVESTVQRQGLNDDTPLERYEDLKTSLLSRYPRDALKSILFNGTSHGCGASTTALNFATVLAKESKLKVLLMEVNLRTPRLHEVFKMDNAIGPTHGLSGSGKLDLAIQKVGPGELYITAFGSKLSARPVGFFESDEFDLFLKEMCERFDYVILDSPPVPIFSEFRVLCSKVDGVVLVVSAGKTRRQVALRAKKELEEAGARLVGVVINRKKYYIPNWVYKFL